MIARLDFPVFANAVGSRLGNTRGLIAQQGDISQIAGRSEDWILESNWVLPPWLVVLIGVVLMVIFAWNANLIRGRFGKAGKASPANRRAHGFVFWGIRSVAVIILLAMLGQWQLTRYETDLPDLVVLVDRSQSMQLPANPLQDSMDTESRWQAARSILLDEDARLLERLSERYRLQVLTIGDKLTSLPAEVSRARAALLQAAPDEASSRLGDQVLQVLRSQRGRSTAAVVMLGDGVVTEGTSLEAAAALFREERLPLTVARVGGSKQPAQVAITELVGDSTAMVGDVVHVMTRIEWASRGDSPIEVELIDADTGEMLATKSVVSRVNGEQDGEAIADLQFIAKQPGVTQLQVRIEPLRGEIATEDNQGQISVNVRNESFRVLLIQGGPSYEFRFLKHLLERATSQDGSRPLVELTSVLQRGDARYAEQDRSATPLPPVSGDALEQLDVVILSDCDPAALGEVLLEKLGTLVVEQGLSLVVLAGPNHLPGALQATALGKLLPVDPSSVRPPVSANQPLRVRMSPLGKSVPQLRIADGDQSWRGAPPIYWLMDVDRMRPGARVLLETEVGAVNATPRPIVVSQLVGNGQVWMHLTDEFFRLEADQMEFDYYERYWLQLVRALARKRGDSGASLAQLTIQGERFRSGMPIPFEVELDPVTTAAADGFVSVAAIDSQGNRFTAEGRPDLRGDRFQGEFLSLPPESYRAVLTRPARDENPATDTFVVLSDSSEMRESVVDVPLLTSVTEQTGGTLLQVQDGAEQLLASLPRGREVRVRPLPPVTIWNHWLVAFALFGLLCTEWVLRRYWGSL